MKSSKVKVVESSPSRKIATIRRQVFVEQMMIEGLSPIAMANLKDSAGKTIGSYDTILNDVKEIQTRWMLADPKWEHRMHVARIEATQRLLAIQIKLNTYLQYDDDTVSIKEKMGILQQLNHNTLKLYEVQSDFDPEQYIEHKISQTMKEEDERKQEDTETGSRQSDSFRAFEARN